MPKISVIMPVYNGEKYLREAIDSILNQTLSDFEFIIINDASTDKTEEIINSYNDSRIKHLKNGTNLGVAGSLNRGLDDATGEYIARMDADDISLPMRFEKQVEFLDKNDDIAVCGCETMIFGSVGEQNTYTVFGKENMKINMLFSSCLAHPAVMMRKDVIDKEHYRYDSDFDKVEDYELWARIIRKYNMDNVKEVLFKYRVHEKQVTKNYNSEHNYRMTEIRRNILNALDIDFNESEFKAYAGYCSGDFKPETQLTDLADIFEKIIKTGFYDNSLLIPYFRQIVFSVYLKQNTVSKKTLINKYSFLTRIDFLKREIKYKVRN